MHMLEKITFIDENLCHISQEERDIFFIGGGNLLLIGTL